MAVQIQLVAGEVVCASDGRDYRHNVQYKLADHGCVLPASGAMVETAKEPRFASRFTAMLVGPEHHTLSSHCECRK